MSSNEFYEPEIDPLEDTHPTLTVPAVRLDEPLPGWRRALGLASLLGAMALTAATIVVLVTSGGDTETPIVTAPTQSAQTQPETPATLPPTQIPQPTPVPAAQTSAQVLPTLNPETLDSLLNTPVTRASGSAQTVLISRDINNPFTVIPDRPRNEIIQYQAVRGDTINGIAERFGLRPETIAWSNDRRIVQVLRPGDLVNIPPVDGVFITAVGRTTIAEYAARYRIADPYVVLDSPLNNLPGLSPESIPPSGTRIFFPGGEAEEITWTPAVVREEGGGSSGNFISFAPGEAGSCGRIANPGGGGAWVNPMGGIYTITRGYASWHTGIDLASSVGTPVRAANGGRVIFVGWNSFGYGTTIVLAHGPFTTLYGHLSGYNVFCGQDVAPGQVIGAVGSTGNSSGPHLHFEIRYLDAPQDPGYTIGF